MFSHDERFLRSLKYHVGVYSPRYFATRDINTRLTLSWALKQFVTRVHTLFSMCSYDCSSVSEVNLHHISHIDRYQAMTKHKSINVHIYWDILYWRLPSTIVLMMIWFHIWGPGCQNQVCQVGISNRIAQYSVECNCPSMAEMPASDAKILIYVYIIYILVLINILCIMVA